MDNQKIDQYLEEHLDESLSELSKLCAQPSVAAQNWGVVECAELVRKMLEARKFDVKVIPTEGAPVVFAERNGKAERTLLFYNHYDVQPPEPLDLWITPPFEPSRRDGKLFARGVSDDKGHIVSRLFAIDALLAENAALNEGRGELPCNIKFVIEGEEEIGSVHLPEFIHQYKDLLAADGCVWEFGGVDFRDVPMQYLGMRGICYVELHVKTAKIDAHSGLGGSIFPNAAWRLVWALASLKGPDEHIRLPGHYAPVIPPDDRDRLLMESLPEVASEYKDRYGVDHFIKGLEGGVELRIAESFEPTCTICGLTSGYQGAGSKTVLPAEASAKVDFRLALGQTPQQVLSSLRSHLDDNGFSDVEIKFLGGEPAARTDPDHPFVKLAIDAANEVYDHPMEIVPMIGGSGPNYPFIHELGLPVVTAGVGYPGSQAHAPNENIRIQDYLRGARYITRILHRFSSG